MKKLLLLSVIFFMLSCTPETDSLQSDYITNLFPEIFLSDEPGLYTNDRGKPVTGTFETHQNGDAMQTRLTFEDGMIVSGAIWGSEGRPRSEYAMEDGLASVTYLNEKGQQTVRFYFEGNMNNIAGTKSWYEDGSPERISTQSYHKAWHPNGRLASEILFVDGRAEGTGYHWHENGALKAENNFKNDQWHGAFRSWDDAGNLLEERFYNMGMPHGTQKFWDSGGNLLEEKHYENGEFIEQVSY